MPHRRKNIRFAVMLSTIGLLLVFVIYSPALYGPFLFDDLYLPFAVPQMRSAPLAVWLANAHTRVALIFTYWLNYQLSATRSTFGYHLVNLLLHLLNGLLVYLVVSGILSKHPRAESKRRLLASFAALLFLVHPLQTEAVSYIAGRSETLSAAFCLAAFAIFLRPRSATISTSAALAILLLFALACLTKEHSLVLLPLLLLTDYYWNPGFTLAGIRANRRLYLPIAVLGLLALAYVGRTLALAKTAGFGMADLPWYEYFFTQCRMIWIYIGLFFFPSGQNVDHDVALSRNLAADSAALAGFLALAALALAAWYRRKRDPLLSYGVLTLLLLLAPTSSFLPIRDLIAEHRFYLPSLGLLLILVGLLDRWRARQAFLTVAMVVVLLGAAGLTFARNRLWGDAIAIWQDSVSKSPRKVRPRFSLAYALYDSGRCAEAVEEYRRAARLAPPAYELLLDWGLALDCAGNRAETIAVLEKAAALQKTAHVYALLGMEHAKDGRLAHALALLDQAESIDPAFEPTFLYRGNVHALLGEQQKAIADFRKALALNAEDTAARQALQQLGP